MPPRREHSYSGETYTGAALTEEEVAFGKAVERWKRGHDGRTPDCREVLAILLQLGYRKTVQPET